VSVSLGRRLAAEALGTAGLLAVVVGSGIMGENLAGGNAAIALLANSLATAGGLYVLILAFAQVSGAHFNPALTLTEAMSGRMAWREFPAYAMAQVAGGLIGVWVAHAMFALPLLQLSTKVRTGPSQWIAECVATFGLVACIRLVSRAAPTAVAGAVAAYIGAAYWFTASTSFANPAVTLARSLSDTFAGIAPGGIGPFIAAQIVGALLAVGTCRWLEPRSR
jgi:glycerol uptake facilitator-like aquaporin